MLFVTNRFPEQSIRTRIGRKFDFDLDNNAASNSVSTTIPVLSGADDVAVSPDGSLVYVSTVANGVGVINTATNTPWHNKVNWTVRVIFRPR